MPSDPNKRALTPADVVGLAKPSHDIHTLGLTTVADLLSECGINTDIADDSINKAFSSPQKLQSFAIIKEWIVSRRITVLGVSFRLDPTDAVLMFGRLHYQLDQNRLLSKYGGPISKLYFAGLPKAVDEVLGLYPDVGVFYGDESPAETIVRLGIDPSRGPREIFASHPFDEYLTRFGTDIVKAAAYRDVLPVDRKGGPTFGSKHEKLIDRIAYGRDHNLPPLMRAHIGPYHANRRKALNEFSRWLRNLSASRHLDIVSIGTSQLTQERFGEDWADAKNGGGVPVNSEEEYREIYEAARPMLVRTYAGTARIPQMAKVHEETINIAWHALSLWWFSEIDGRGRQPLIENLHEQFQALSYIAKTGKPAEPNLPHHFGFRGADDVTYVVSAVIAAKVFKRCGIRDFVLQLMLNVPKHTLSFNDLAKARACLSLINPLRGGDFRVLLQPRAGLDLFSHEPLKAKAQLAHATALMDAIQPADFRSPDIIHVVGYSEGYELAGPDVVDESIQITRFALEQYRKEKVAGHAPDMLDDEALEQRYEYLMKGASLVIDAIEREIPDPYSPEGLHQMFSAGFLPVPDLLYCREKFPAATQWRSKVRNGGVDLYDDNRVVPARERVEAAIQHVRKIRENK